MMLKRGMGIREQVFKQRVRVLTPLNNRPNSLSHCGLISGSQEQSGTGCTSRALPVEGGRERGRQTQTQTDSDRHRETETER